MKSQCLSEHMNNRKRLVTVSFNQKGRGPKSGRDTVSVIFMIALSPYGTW